MPPPIIVHGFFDNYAQAVGKIQKEIGNNFTVKFTKNNTNIFCKSKEQWTKVNKLLNEQQVEFHTYIPAEEKTHAFVLRGLDQRPTPKEIAEDLENNYNLLADKIYEMKGTARPLYLVVMDKNITIDKLEKHIRIVLYTKVQWERHQNNKLIVQCHRCQEWGHATSNCHANPKCLKCAGPHLTRECEHGHLNSPKCANCNGDHVANSTMCPIYIKKIEFINQLRQTKDTK
ncbi:hypothetical protein BDFB_013312, partial [Asbolus verrucosus]